MKSLINNGVRPHPARGGREKAAGVLSEALRERGDEHGQGEAGGDGEDVGRLRVPHPVHLQLGQLQEGAHGETDKSQARRK